MICDTEGREGRVLDCNALQKGLRRCRTQWWRHFCSMRDCRNRGCQLSSPSSEAPLAFCWAGKSHPHRLRRSGQIVLPHATGTHEGRQHSKAVAEGAELEHDRHHQHAARRQGWDRHDPPLAVSTVATSEKVRHLNEKSRQLDRSTATLLQAVERGQPQQETHELVGGTSPEGGPQDWMAMAGHGHSCKGIRELCSKMKGLHQP